jgi:hypothetical protein
MGRRAGVQLQSADEVILSSESFVGSLMRQTGGTAGDRWFWSTTCVLIDPEESPRVKCARRREDNKDPGDLFMR